jgi:hypothetical protein
MSASTPITSFLCAALALAFLSPYANAQRGSPSVRATERVSDPRPLEGHVGFVPRVAQKAAGQLPVIVLTGYWPPSNEAVRRFSTSATQNPQGWIGGNWENRGYDIHAFFPEFSPPNCNNCGKGTGDLEVDYQDTTADFWTLIPALTPVAVVTFSRGFIDDSWELELNQYNRLSWINDFVAPFQPTPAPPDASVPAGWLRPGSQPVQAIADAVNAALLGVDAYAAYSGDGGGYLSEFIAYDGVWYQAQHADPSSPTWCIAAGHVHVGGQLTWSQAQEAAKETLRTLTGYLDTVLQVPCAQPQRYCAAKLASNGCLPSIDSVGYPSLSNGSFALRATKLVQSSPGVLIWGANQASVPFQNGTLCVGGPFTRAASTPQAQNLGLGPCWADAWFYFLPAYRAQHGFTAGQTLHGQFWARDLGDPFGSSLTDALSFTWCP